MGFFSFIQEIAMDLGTANTIIISDDKIVVDEPSVVALDRRTDKMIAVGERAKMMYEKTHENIRTIRPLRDGVIADFSACEQMMRGLIKMVHSGRRFFGSPSLRMVIGVPSGSTEVELRAVRDSAEHADGRDVYLIFEPMAAAIWKGILIFDSKRLSRPRSKAPPPVSQIPFFTISAYNSGGVFSKAERTAFSILATVLSRQCATS